MSDHRGRCAVVFKCKVPIGETQCTEAEIDALVERMGREYLGTRYHLLQTNCNHFSSDLCYALCGKRPPPWINRLAGCVVNVHCLFPPSWLPPLRPPTMDPTNPRARPPRITRLRTLRVTPLQSSPTLAAWCTCRLLHTSRAQQVLRPQVCILRSRHQLLSAPSPARTTRILILADNRLGVQCSA
jgi:PPPDE putative peptidase domain